MEIVISKNDITIYAGPRLKLVNKMDTIKYIKVITYVFCILMHSSGASAEFNSNKSIFESIVNEIEYFLKNLPKDIDFNKIEMIEASFKIEKTAGANDTKHFGPRYLNVPDGYVFCGWKYDDISRNKGSYWVELSSNGKRYVTAQAQGSGHIVGGTRGWVNGVMHWRYFRVRIPTNNLPQCESDGWSMRSSGENNAPPPMTTSCKMDRVLICETRGEAPRVCGVCATASVP